MRYKCTCQYDGSAYSGFQRQKKARTIQGEIEKALKRIYNHAVTIHSASRTDKGVHALAQIFHYDTNIDIDIDKLASIINRQLPKDIYVSTICGVNNSFHARYSVISKTYQYKIITSKAYNVFLKNYYYHYNKKIDLVALNDLATHFIGVYDYKAFMASGSDKLNTVREIYDINFEQLSDSFTMTISGNGFLYNMVRIMMGMFLDYAEGGKTKKCIITQFTAGNRQFFKRTAPACGLYLKQINYNE